MVNPSQLLDVTGIVLKFGFTRRDGVF